jgi:hypothetical protein
VRMTITRKRVRMRSRAADVVNQEATTSTDDKPIAQVRGPVGPVTEAPANWYSSNGPGPRDNSAERDIRPRQKSLCETVC